MNIGRSQIQAAQRAARNRNLTERARQSNEAAFRRHLQQAATNDTDVQQPMPPLPPVDGEEVHPEDGGEDETFMSAQDRALNSPYNAINSDDGDDNLNDGTDYGFDPHGSEEDYAAERYSINDRIMHFLFGNRINRLSRQAVEIAVAIHALTVVMSEQTTNAAARNEKTLQVYKDTLNAFDDECFEVPGLKTLMLNKLYNAQHNITGARLYAKALEWRSDIRNGYMPCLPQDLSTLPSGTGLRDAYKKFILRRYKEANPGVVDGMEDDEIDVEHDFWLKHISMRCLLATMVHRKNKEIANDCSSQPAGATRDAIRANARASLNTARAQESAAARDSDPEFRMFKRIKLNKTQMEIISSQSDVISLQLKLFQENKDTFIAKNGDDAFNEKITALLEKLPDPVVNLMEEQEESQQQDAGSP